MVERGRGAAVPAALPYTAAVLSETGQVAPGVGELNPPRFLATAPDGRRMAEVLEGGVITAKQAVAGGATVQGALSSGGSRLVADVLTVMADTRRQVYHADIIQRPTLGGYTRMLNTPSCSRCVLLAGKWFGWNKGFQRHPRCDCQHIPTSKALATESMLNPMEYFNSLSLAEQNKVFTKSGARAIRDGADINRVVNRSGMKTVYSGRGRKRVSRLSVDDVYRVAGTRENAIRLLTQEGYILPAFGR